MFEQTAGDGLRQGDLGSGLWLPQINLNRYQIARSPFGKEPPTVTSPLIDKGNCDTFSILSHDCDLDNIKPAQRGGVIVAPLVDFPFAVDHASFQTLAESQTPDPETSEYDYINLFPLELPMAVIDTLGAGWKVIDFSLMASVGPPKGVKQILAPLKRLEMTDVTRDALRLKLAAFFGRSQEAHE